MRFKCLLLVTSIIAGSGMTHVSYATSSYEESSEENIRSKACEALRAKCLYEVDQFIDFLSAQKEEAKKKVKNREIDYQYNLNDILMSIEELKEHHKYVENIKIKNTDDLLYYFLEKRLKSLGYFNRQIQERKTLISQKYPEERIEFKYKNVNTFYHFFNAIISSLYELTPFQALSYKTRCLISMSPALWPVLKKETLELGDFETLFESDHDFDLYNTFLSKETMRDVPIYGLGMPAGSKMMQMMTRYDASLMDQHTKKIKELREPAWLQQIEESQKKKNALKS